MLNIKAVIESYTSVEPFGDDEEMETYFRNGQLYMVTRKRKEDVDEHKNSRD